MLKCLRDFGCIHDWHSVAHQSSCTRVPRAHGGVRALARPRQALVRRVVQDVVVAGVRSSSSGTVFNWAIKALSLVAVSDSNKLPMLEHGDTRACDACAAVLRWGTSLTSEAAPRAGASVPGASSSHRNWSSEILYAARRSAAETLFQLSLSQVGKGALLAHAACVQVIRHHAREKGSAVSAQCRPVLRLVPVGTLLFVW